MALSRYSVSNFTEGPHANRYGYIPVFCRLEQSSQIVCSFSELSAWSVVICKWIVGGKKWYFRRGWISAASCLQSSRGALLPSKSVCSRAPLWTSCDPWSGPPEKKRHGD